MTVFFLHHIGPTEKWGDPGQFEHQCRLLVRDAASMAPVSPAALDYLKSNHDFSYEKIFRQPGFPDLDRTSFKLAKSASLHPACMQPVLG